MCQSVVELSDLLGYYAVSLGYWHPSRPESSLQEPTVKLKVVHNVLKLYTPCTILYEVSYTVNQLLCTRLYPNSHIHHNYAFRHYYFAIVRKIQCFQLILNTHKMVCYNVIYLAFNVTRTCECFCSRQVLVFIVYNL